MSGVDRSLISHVIPNDGRKPVRQKKINFGVERQKVIKEEVDRLLKAGFIREVYYPKWLSNMVLVRNSVGRWRMCVDFTDLNKACPKDSYPLPCIDQLVYGSWSHQMLSFLDAFLGYNQIKMKKEDEEKTSFITEFDTLYYTMMSFDLKNGGVTCQRMMNQVFNKQLGRNLEVYVDDMVVKSTIAEAHTADLKEVFEVLKKNNMRLNPKKCVFEVKAGKFLGFMITERGIEAILKSARLS